MESILGNAGSPIAFSITFLLYLVTFLLYLGSAALLAGLVTTLFDKKKWIRMIGSPQVGLRDEPQPTRQFFQQR